ncbi:allatostatin-A receptor-like [Haliotis rubra]|uniref:allatostatin-A receptor-like n=1 Tax=Haliotis rubra TaxID=36100 RepID=UPI001EE52FCA|nr:allatostatin-A receptor-like [Haliotis rubra]XP_046563121.1 allatostatin-A receptor-like [Haliotis rubra]XP_046563122.1 allatostatin-A receptor-like [Haliotis rubra]
MSRGQAELEIELLELTTVTPSNVSQNASCMGVGCNNTGLSPMYEFERLVSIIVPTIFGVVFILGLIGNLMVILVVVSDKKMRNTTNILILSLAFADLFFIIFCVPFTAAGYALPVWPFGNAWCKLTQFMAYVCATASVYTLVLMSLDRYLAVVHAIRSMRYRTERNTWLAVVVTWGGILLGNIPILFQYGELAYQHDFENRSACLNVASVKDPQVGMIFFSCFLAFGYAIPLGAVCLMYGLMLKRLLYGVVPGGNQSAESIRAKKRVTRMVIIVVVSFALCWLPIQIILIIRAFGHYPHDMGFVGLQMAANCLAYMNSCVNPFLYAFLSENFKRSFRKFICCFSVTRLMDYERTNIRSEKDSKSTCITRTTLNNV